MATKQGEQMHDQKEDNSLFLKSIFCFIMELIIQSVKNLKHTSNVELKKITEQNASYF